MDETILKQTCMSKRQLRRYVTKLNQFFRSLTKAERRVFLASMGTAENAMRSFHPKLTRQQLEAFLNSLRGRDPEEVVFFIEGLDRCTEKNH